MSLVSPEAELGPPDSHRLLAATGWLELGNPAEAEQELAAVSPTFQEHPDVLEVRWEIGAARHDWAGALRAAERLRQTAPERVSGWIHRAYAMRRVPGGGLPLAWAALRPAYDQFPKHPLIAFNLACYAAQFERLDEAWEWLHKAMEAAGDVAAIKRMSLADDDLKPLWDRIREL